MGVRCLRNNKSIGIDVIHLYEANSVYIDACRSRLVCRVWTRADG